ncbi:MAG: NFYB/HAP3 family transcription factor subunit [Nanoarchaeota archaeon]|nr:NFYB/HAP3 family transcription factor subunit [Nanoarchaeota archaeon]
MAKRQNILPKAAAIKLIEKAGAPRVADAAGEELVEILQDIGIKIAQKAIIFSEHAGRKTVKASDIKLAAKEF